MAIPAPALEIMELIRLTETGRADQTAYETIYSHAESKLTKPITEMTVAELQKHQPGFTKSFGSSASGAYQFMFATLKDLRSTLNLTGQELFDAELQDRLGYQLLLRRGYQPWIDGKTTTDTWMVGLAKEWASFPVPSRMKGAHRVVERGETWYAGDKLNRALIGPDKVWLACEAARAAKPKPPPEPVPPKPEQPPAEATTDASLDELMAALQHPDVKAAIAAVLAAETDEDGA